MKLADAVDKAFKRVQRDLREGRDVTWRGEHERNTAGTRRRPGLAARVRRGGPGIGGLHGADYVWAIAFALPYVAIFLAFVVYPIGFGLWMGSDVGLYEQLFSDPRYLTTVVNTLLYVVIGVNLKMFLAFLLSGFFIRKGWWIKALLVIFILPWATPALPAYMSIHWFLNGQWGMLNNVLYVLFDIDGPVYLNEHWTGLALQHRRLYLEDPAVLDDDPAGGRMAVPQELYEAAAVDGATGLRRFAHVTLPLMANLYLVCTLLDMVFALGDFNSTFFVSGGGPAMSTEVLATLGIRYAFTLALPRPRRGGGDVGAAVADPAGHPADAQAAYVGGPAMSATTAGPADRIPRCTTGCSATGSKRRVWRSASCIVVWSVTPIYNMWMIALDSHDDIFGGSLWPESPTLESFPRRGHPGLLVPGALLAPVRQQLHRRPVGDVPDLVRSARWPASRSGGCACATAGC